MSLTEWKAGIDIGSTTVKMVLLDEENRIIYKRYERHMSDVFLAVKKLLEEFQTVGPDSCRICITGSGGLSLAEHLHLPFRQEVIACSEAVKQMIPQTDVAIELGGEDAKITFYDKTIEQRMNGTCAGGTGAFIDQMALLLNTDAAGLNEAAKEYRILYPIAARCGVFAKTDIQPLINEGARRADLAASIFQAVVDQTIAGLACGRKIRGNVAFLGGPLSYLPELRKRFSETLKLSEEQIVFPENAQYYPAMGAALLAEKEETEGICTAELIKRMEQPWAEQERECLPALFACRKDYEDFKERHEKARVVRRDFAEAEGPLFLGIDAGSTTTKASVIDEEGRLLFTAYRNNEGNPAETCRQILLQMYRQLPEKAWIAFAMTTGYGEELMKAAFHADEGEIETVAHYYAAKSFLPEVDAILDIGGQDMKYITIHDGAIGSIVLNEACSSGCGSFLETYARSVGIDIAAFSEIALTAEHPVDLGTRCTVFMNSKVKQAQKEGACLGDIAAGLAGSVVRNALYKVLKLRNPEELGQNIVVQGGTFRNDAVLRSLELILGREVIRPDIAGLMGAYGAALLGKKKYEEMKEWGEVCSESRSSLLTADALDIFRMETSHRRCEGCQNRCQLTISRFSGGSRHITGNRCEKGAGNVHQGEMDHLNLFQYKYKRLFAYEPLPPGFTRRGTVGIPRVLNMYENYPFWHTFFTKLGFRVILSPDSSRKIYEKGMDTIISDTACYPAKLVHGHVQWLAEQDVDMIFYPAITFEKPEDETAPNHFNCPVVGMYPDVIGGNMDDVLKEHKVRLLNPFLPYNDDRRLAQRMMEELHYYGVTGEEAAAAVAAARKEDQAFRADIARKADEIIEEVERTGGHGIVLAGRPYHLDPEISHGIDKLLVSCGFAVLTESSVTHRSHLQRPLRVLDQWMYHSRLYKAADFCCSRDDMDLIQLNSFGCGIDAITADQVEELLEAHNKLYTILKIDEGSNLGAARIRIRSLKAAIKERKEKKMTCRKEVYKQEYPLYTKEMKKEYTLLVPQMAPMQFDLMAEALRTAGYRAELLPHADRQAVETGLKYINNDACYPAIVTLGQIIQALQSGRYDLNRTAVMMAQTGGGCRASNYIALLRKALKQMGMEQVPVISFNFNKKMEKNPGFRFTLPFSISLLYAVLYGDLFMRLTNAVRPYEKEPGSTMNLYRRWNEAARENLRNRSWIQFTRNIRSIVADFDTLPVHENLKKPKVGVVGEILVKYHPDANNDIVGIIEQEGGEAVVPDLLDFIMYTQKCKEFCCEKLDLSRKARFLGKLALAGLYGARRAVDRALEKSRRFQPHVHIDHIAQLASQVTSLGTQCGEGWMLSGEMQELIENGVRNIVILQPFGCLPNHIVGKGVMKPLRKLHDDVNLAAIDYDPGASHVNQLNRIKLMMSVAHSNLKKEM